jgi:TPR repeat protein
VFAVVGLLGAAAWWLPCWGGRMASCDFWCSVGSATACNVLARNHDDGDGTDIRDDLAVAFYREACARGNLTGCVNLGIMYENAEGVAPNPEAAAEQFRRACPAKLTACRRLASLMVDNKLIDDAGAAADALERACDGHDAEAMKSCNALARMYDSGRGVPRDDRHAVRLYHRACDGHLGVACFNLSLMYRRGEGVARNTAEADTLKARSCQNSAAPRCR